METIMATTNQKRAREIMGRNFFGVEEAIQHFGLKPTQAQLSALAEVPFTEAELCECKDTHVLVAVFLSFLEIRDKVATKISRLFCDQNWYVKQAFAKEKGEAKWWLVRKTPVPNSTLKTWPEQRALLQGNEEVPPARVMIYTIIGHFLSTAERLFECVYVRCSAGMDSYGYRVLVGYFDSGGLSVYGYFWGAGRDFDIGVSAARLPAIAL